MMPLLCRILQIINMHFWRIRHKCNIIFGGRVGHIASSIAYVPWSLQNWCHFCVEFSKYYAFWRIKHRCNDIFAGWIGYIASSIAYFTWILQKWRIFCVECPKHYAFFEDLIHVQQHFWRKVDYIASSIAYVTWFLLKLFRSVYYTPNIMHIGLSKHRCNNIFGEFKQH